MSETGISIKLYVSPRDDRSWPHETSGERDADYLTSLCTSSGFGCNGVAPRRSTGATYGLRRVAQKSLYRP